MDKDIRRFTLIEYSTPPQSIHIQGSNGKALCAFTSGGTQRPTFRPGYLDQVSCKKCVTQEGQRSKL
jgi:hypothetical protein